MSDVAEDVCRIIDAGFVTRIPSMSGISKVGRYGSDVCGGDGEDREWHAFLKYTGVFREREIGREGLNYLEVSIQMATQRLSISILLRRTKGYRVCSKH